MGRWRADGTATYGSTGVARTHCDHSVAPPGYRRSTSRPQPPRTRERPRSRWRPSTPIRWPRGCTVGFEPPSPLRRRRIPASRPCHSSPSRTVSLPYSPLRGGTEADPCARPSRLQSSDGRPRSSVHARLALSLWWCCRRVIPPGCSIGVALGPRRRAMQIGLPKCP